MRDTPKRIQLSRRKGWKKPEGVVNVARPSKWGNQYRVGMWVRLRPERLPIQVVDARVAVALFTIDATTSETFKAAARAELRGKDLACWCKPSEPCHADVLLELANQE